MIQFNKLENLSQHHAYLSQLLKNKDIFLVGGCIRDLLLGNKEDPIDIDITMSGDPGDIRDAMSFDEEKLSRFRTEKFGTMTFLSKESAYEYELTPFRTEEGYEDNRHPDEITRSDSILSDSARRDFTINSLYLYTTQSAKLPTPSDILELDAASLKKTLIQGSTIYLHDSSVLILQDHKTINTLFATGILQENALEGIIQQAVQGTMGEETIPDKNEISILVDPYGGLIDLLKGTIRTAGNPDLRFSEDALRIIRGLRFVNTLNQSTDSSVSFDFEKKTWLSMQSNAQLVNNISSERIHDELKKVFSKHNPFGYITLVKEIGLLPSLFPSLSETIHNEQPVRYHSFDTYTHTMLCLFELQKIIAERATQSDNDYLVKLAMLYHDVGKPEQYEKMGEAIAANPENPDRSGYEYHTESGAKLAAIDFKALSHSKKEIEQIARYIRRHHRPGEILDGKKEKWPVRLRKLMSDGGYEATMNLLDITIADRRGQYNPLQSPAIEEIEQLKTLVTQLFEDEGRFTSQDMNISGKDIMETLEIQAGPTIGVLLAKAFDRVISDVNSRNEKEKILKYIGSLEIS